VDFLWSAQKLVVEVDSWRFHGHRRAFERDRRKDLALQAAGYQVIRITAKQLAQQPLLVVAQIARVLDRATRLGGEGSTASGEGSTARG
jgi:very-short-patch-repair endonuclease